MEYNKTKKTVDKVAGIFGIISAVLYMILALILIIVAFTYFSGGHDYSYHYYDAYYGGWITEYEDYSYMGTPYMLWGLLLLTMAILMLIFSIKLVKSPYLPNGELRKKQGARIWVLVLSILMGDLVVMGLMIAALCIKDFKDPCMQQPANFNVSNGRMMQPMADQKFYDFYDKIQEVKKLKSLGIIDETAYKKAVTKIVVDITNE